MLGEEANPVGDAGVPVGVSARSIPPNLGSGLPALPLDLTVGLLNISTL